MVNCYVAISPYYHHFEEVNQLYMGVFSIDGKRIIVRETSDSDTLYVIFLWSLEISFNHMQCICVVVMKCWWNNPRREPQGQNDNSPKFATGIKFIAFLLNYRDFAERRLRLFSELFQYFFTYPMNRQWYIHVLSIYHMYPISEVSRSFYCQFGASWRTKWTWLEWLRRSYDIIVATGHSEECVQPGALGNGANSVQLEKSRLRWKVPWSAVDHGFSAGNIKKIWFLDSDFCGSTWCHELVLCCFCCHND